MYELCLNLHANMITEEADVSKSTNIIKSYGLDNKTSVHNKNFLLEFEELADLYNSIWDIIQKTLNELSFGVQVLVRLVEHHLTNIALSILFELGKYPYL